MQASNIMSCHLSGTVSLLSIAELVREAPVLPDILPLLFSDSIGTVITTLVIIL